jgi:hypothetical protein
MASKKIGPIVVDKTPKLKISIAPWPPSHI